MRQLILAAIAMVFLLVNAQNSNGNRVVESLQVGDTFQQFGQSIEIDWTTGVIRARGAGTAASGLTLAQARLRAMGAARADAQRLLATAIGEVRITSDTVVVDYVLASDTVRTQLEVVLRGIVYPENGVRIERLADGSFIVYALAEMPLYGPDSLASVVYQGVRDSFVSPESRANYLEPTSDAPYSVPMLPEVDGATVTNGREAEAPVAPGAYTGLIVDASDFSVDATMAPRIFSESGAVVYGVLSTSTEFANDIGVVGYHRSLEAARADYRVGEYPLIVNAIDVIGKNIFREHPVISDGDANAVMLADAAVGFLKRAKVVFVVR